MCEENVNIRDVCVTRNVTITLEVTVSRRSTTCVPESAGESRVIHRIDSCTSIVT